jgi:hypothetical protein
MVQEANKAKACGVIGRKTIEIKDVNFELFGGSPAVDRCGRRAALGDFLACCHRQLLALFSALDPAIFDKTKKPEKYEIRDGSTNRKHVNGNHGS